MLVTVITYDQEGFQTYTGRVVCRGTSTVVLLLTEPSTVAGRSVQLDIDDIVEEKVISA